MRSGEFSNGERVLRAKIDMASGNINLRDPVLYRIARDHFHGPAILGIYPTYDFAHGNPTRSKVSRTALHARIRRHRPLYDWLIENLPCRRAPVPEFSRLNCPTMFFRNIRLIQLVEEGHVNG